MLVKILIIFIYVGKLSQAKVEHSADTKACPQFFSKYNGSVDELLGNWHVALVMLDETEEKFEEQSVCIRGRFYKLNSTNLIQIWNIGLPEILRQDKTEIDFPTRIIEPGTWLVQSPLGGQFRGTIMEGDGSSYVIIVYCGWQDEKLMHMMTLALSRSNVVTPNLKLQLLATLVQNGYQPFKSKIISWGSCDVAGFLKSIPTQIQNILK